MSLHLFGTWLSRINAWKLSCSRVLTSAIPAQVSPEEYAAARVADGGALTLLVQPVIDTACRRMVQLRVARPDVATCVTASGSKERLGSTAALGYRIWESGEFEAACLIAKMRLVCDDGFAAVSLTCGSEDLAAAPFLACVHDSLCATGLSPRQLELTFPETIFLEPKADIRNQLETLSSWGVRLGVTNFGSGSAPLACFENADIGSIHLSPHLVGALALVRAAPHYPLAVVRAVIEAATLLDLTVVASGIDTFEQFQLLQSLGCIYQQGDFFGEADSVPATLGSVSHPARQAGSAGGIDN